MSPQPRLLLLGAVLALGACADPEDRSTDFNYLHATIIEPMCATSGCHSAAVAAGPLDSNTGERIELDFSSPAAAFRNLASDQDITVECGSGVEFPESGYLTLFPGLDAPIVDYLEGEGPNTVYPQMPIDMRLAPAEIELIKRWVEDGAPCE